MCSQEGLLDLENEEHVVFYLGRAQLLLPPAILEYPSTGDNSSCPAWGPSISCLGPYIIQMQTHLGLKTETSLISGPSWV